MAYRHKYVIGSTYAFYNNSDELEDNANFNYWGFDLVHADTFIPVYEDVATLTKDIISGSDYRWYATDFVFPTVDTGCYRFVVIDTADSDRVLYISDIFEVVDSDDGLIYTKYRNDKSILNYNYENLPSFYNKFHVEVFKRKPLRPQETEGYPLYSGSFFPVRTTITKSYEFITDWFDESEHEAFQDQIMHNDNQMALDGNYETVIKTDSSEYEIDWQENYEFIQAAVRLQIDDESSSNAAI